jgi:hypothetical protein
MDNFLQKSEAWINHYNDDWFRSSSPLLCPHDAYKCAEALAMYADTIDTLRVMAKCVKNGQVWLKKGQAYAKEMLASMKNPSVQLDAEHSGTPESDEEQDDYGLDQLEEP